MAQQSGDQLIKKDIPLNGKLVTSDDGVMVGTNFTTLQNMRYTDTHPQGIRGMTKINPDVLANPHIRSAYHFVKTQPVESHLLTQAYDASDANSKVYTNDTAIPNAGDFNANALHTDAAGVGRGFFASGPGGACVYCNSAESLIWGGDEMVVGAFVNYDPAGSFKYDFTDVLQNTMSDAENSAILVPAPGTGIDTHTKLILHLDSDVTDSSSSPNTVTNVNMTFDALNFEFGGGSGKFDGATAYLTIPNNSGFNLSGGVWTIDTWFMPAAFTAGQCIYSQITNANNWFRLYVDTTGAVLLKYNVSGTESTIVSTLSAAVTAGVFQHIEVSQGAAGYKIFVNGQLAGSSSKATVPANYSGLVYIGARTDGTSVLDYLNGDLDEFRLSSGIQRHTANFTTPVAPYSTSTPSSVTCYIGSSLSLNGIKIYVASPNTVSGAISVNYWDGSTWVAVSNLVDGTAGMTQTGFITFDDTQAVAKQSVRDSLSLYWYELALSASNATSIYYVTLGTAMQPIADIWDGVERTIASCEKYNGHNYVDYTNNVFDDSYSSADPSTFLNIGTLPPSQNIAIGFSDRMTAVHFYLGGGKVNSVATTQCTVSYWNGQAWVDVGTVIDGTSVNNVSLADTGIISWDAPPFEDEFTQSLNRANDALLYYYQFAFSTTLDTTVEINYVTGIPAPVQIYPYKFPLAAMDRIWLCSNQADKQNSMICSNSGTANVLNGSDSVTFYFGDSTELTAGCWLYSQYGTTLYNTLVITKVNGTYIVVGDNPSQWAQYQVSPTIGCPAPQTMVALPAPSQMFGGYSRTVAIWQGNESIVMFDGKGFLPINNDISDYFDERKPYSINRAMISESKAFYDDLNKEYHWLFASGTSTTLDKELVYDVHRNKWFEIVRGSGKQLQCGCTVTDLQGNLYNYGFIDTGYMELLENGTDFDGNAIVGNMVLGDLPLDDLWKTTAIRWLRLATMAKTNTTNPIILSHWGDTSSASQTVNMSPSKPGFRVAMPILSEQCNQFGDYVLHRFGFSLTTNNEAYGFEPLALSVKFIPKHESQR